MTFPTVPAGPPPLEQPSLAEPERPGTGRVVDGGDKQAMVEFRDGTWRLCHVVAWRRAGDRWLCRIRWGVRGQQYDGWFVHDPERVSSLDH